MILVNKRNIAACIILTIVTGGIYGIYWYYLLVKNIRAITKDDNSCTGEMLCLILVPFYSVYWWYTRGRIVKDQFAEHGYSAKGSEIAFLILSLFGLDIISMAIMQSDFNALPSENTQSNQRSASEMNDRSFVSSLRAALKKSIMLIVLVVVYLFFAILTGGGILKPSSFSELINQNTYVYILGAGMLMCMLTGGNIDLSCGSFVCLLGAFGGVFMIVQGMNTGLSILFLLLIGVAYGAVLGALIAYLHIPPWIATLAGFLAFRGLGTAILTANSKTGSLAPFPRDFQNIFYGRLFPTDRGELNLVCLFVGLAAAALVVMLAIRTRMVRKSKGYELEPIGMTMIKVGLECFAIILVMTMLALDGGIPTTLVWVAGIILIYAFITSKTTTGRHFYVVGGNIEAARLSGVNTRGVMFLAYLNMAVLTTIAAMTVVARSQSAYADVGKNFEMDAISACVVGGVSASGGAGTVLGMVIGATLIGVINLGMSLISLDANWQRIIKGVVLLAAVVFDILSQKRQK